MTTLQHLTRLALLLACSSMPRGADASTKTIGALPCDEITFQVNTLKCISPVKVGQAIWSGIHQNSENGLGAMLFQSSPNFLFLGDWTYVQPDRDTKWQGGCNAGGGGFVGAIKKPAVVSICCANHGPPPIPIQNYKWTRVSGVGAVSNHNHAPNPCTFFETTVEPGKHRFCCANTWSSGIFLAKPHATTTQTTTTNTILDALHGRVGEVEDLLSVKNQTINSLKHEVTLLAQALKTSEMQHTETKKANAATALLLKTLTAAVTALRSDHNDLEENLAANAVWRGGRPGTDDDDGGDGAPASKPTGACKGAADSCSPSFVSDGSDVKVSACCGSVKFESSACSVDPCVTSQDVEDIKAMLGL